MTLRMGSALLPALSLSLAAAVPGQFSPSALSALRLQEPQRVDVSRTALLNQRSSLGLGQDASFTARRSHTDQFGETHARFAQTYRGVQVMGGEIITHMDARGRQLAPTDAAFRNINLNTVPSLAADEAIAAAHRDLAPRGAYATAPRVELVVYPITTETRQGHGNGALSFRSEVVRYALAYHVHTELENALETAHMDYLVDAHTGAILKKWSTLETAKAGKGKPGGGGSLSGTPAIGTGNSQYSGTVSLNTTAVTAGGYAIQDMTRGTGGTFGHNVVTNLANSTRGNGTVYQGDADNVWGDGQNYVEGTSTTAANGQTAAVDAAFGAASTWDYYKNVHGRNGIDNAGTATYSRVHYSRAYDNAFWSDSCFCMTYGDGSSFLTLTSIDVAGHEMSHGVTSRTANLTYSGESGGLNEATSDINGSMVEFMGHGGGTTSVPNYTAITGTISTLGGTVPAANYLIGEQLETSSFAHPLRYMYKPSLDGSSPDAWYSGMGSLDVHYTSGVANHFFFLLSHGSQVDAFSGNIQSPMANGVTSVTGIGNDKAIRIWYRALTTYFTSSTNYAGARTATLKAAADLYGAGSTEYNTVATAWTAVNVN